MATVTEQASKDFAGLLKAIEDAKTAFLEAPTGSTPAEKATYITLGLSLGRISDKYNDVARLLIGRHIV